MKMKKILFEILFSKKKYVLFCVFSLLLESILVLVNPLILKYIIDDVLTQNNISYIPFITLLLVGILLCEALFNFYNAYIINVIIETSEKEFKIEVYNQLFNMKYNNFCNHNREEYINNYIIDINNVFVLITESLKFVINIFFSTVLILSILFYFNTKLTSISLLFMPAYFIIIFLFRRYSFDKYDELRNLVGNENIIFKNYIESMIILRLFNSFKYFVNNIVSILNHLVLKTIKINIFENITSAFLYILSMLSPILVITIGIKLVLLKEITVGILMVFYTYIFKLIPLINQSMNYFYFCQKAVVSYRNLNSLFSYESNILNGSSLNKLSYDNIEINNIGIKRSNKIILDKVTFNIEKGDIICILGGNGSGKTTLLNAIAGLLEISDGSIVIDGINIKNINKNTYFDNISYYTQNCYLLSDTILNNLKMGKDYDISTIIDVCKKLDIYDFVCSLNNSFDYLITGNGETFSGGERKLISFARIFLRQSKLILLDEFSNDLDVKHKEIIRNIIKKKCRNSIVIIVSHNMEDILLANKFIYLKNGCVEKIFSDNINQNLIMLNELNLS